MAKKEIALEVKIQAANSAKTLGEMKSALKALVAEQKNVTRGTEDWKRLSKAINDAEGQIGDLNDSFSTLRGSGIERANSSLGLLREGFTNLDFEKVKIGLGGLKAALAATGIMLLVQGVMSLIENFDELKESTGLVGKIFRGIGDTIDWVVDKLRTFGDWIGLINKDIEDKATAITEGAEKSKAALDEQTKAFDRQMKVAAAAGESTVELEKAKQQAIIDTNLQIVKQIEDYVRAGGELDKERKALLTASLNAIRDAKTEEKVIELKTNKEILDGKEKQYAEHLKNLQKLREDAQKEILAGEETERKNLLTFNQIQAKEKKDQQDAEWAAQIAQDEADIAAFEKRKKEEADFLIKEAATAKQLKDQQDAAFAEADAKKWDAAKGLAEGFFAWQLRANEGDASKQIQIRKRMFEVDKAFNVARAVQDGIRSVQAALTIPPPGGQILAVVNAALAAGNVAKILATKFDAGSSSVPTITAPTQTSIPQINNANNSAPIQPTTQFNEQGQNINVMAKAYIVDSEVNESIEREDKMKRLREF